jgi:hypothetical protein
MSQILFPLTPLNDPAPASRQNVAPAVIPANLPFTDDGIEWLGFHKDAMRFDDRVFTSQQEGDPTFDLTFTLFVHVMGTSVADVEIGIMPLRFVEYAEDEGFFLSGAGGSLRMPLLGWDTWKVGEALFTFTSASGTVGENLANVVQAAPPVPTLLGVLHTVHVTLLAQRGINRTLHDLDWVLITKNASPCTAVWSVSHGRLGVPPEDGGAVGLPWIRIADPDLDWTSAAGGRPSLPGEAAQVKSLAIDNFGTAPLVIRDTPIGGGFALPAPGPGGVVLSIPTGSSGALDVSFTPGALGPSSEIVTLDHNDTHVPAPAVSGHNAGITLSADVKLLDVVMVLDASGSMGWGRNPGEYVPPADERRWDHLTETVHQASGALWDFFQGAPGGVRLQALVFPDVVAGTPSIPGAARVWPQPGHTETLTAAVPLALRDHLDGITPVGGTPIGAGLSLAVGGNTPQPGLFLDDANTFRSLLLMTDGEHNTGIAPEVFIDKGGSDAGELPLVPDPDPTDQYPDLLDKQVAVFAVGYGNDAAADTDPARLARIANYSGSRGTAVMADTAVAASLKKTFRTYLVDTFGLTQALDPIATVTWDDPVQYHELVVTEFDQSMALFVDWETPDRYRLDVEVITPRCEHISEDSAEKYGVTYRNDRRFKYFFFGPEFLRPKDGRARHGVWQLKVRLSPQSEVDLRSPSDGDSYSETYSYETITQSGLVLTAKPAAKVLTTGEPIALTAKLSNGNLPVTRAGVTARVVGPQQSFSRWLAAQSVSPEAYAAKAKELQAQGVTSPWTAKLHTLSDAGVRFEPGAREVVVPLVETADGTYAVDVDATRFEGRYALTVVARAESRTGASLRRECTAEVQVEVVPDAGRTRLDLELGPKDSVRVTVWPRDRFDNPVLFDPASNDRVRLVARDARLVGQLTANLDGSYSQLVEHERCGTPTVSLVIDRKTVLTRRIVVPADLQWVDRLLDHRPGTILVPGSNRHDQPNAVLGPVATSEDAFLSLGSLGNVTVGRARGTWRARSITVFTRRFDRLRPYRVEAKLDHGSSWGGRWSKSWRNRWVVLGESSGVTETFDLSDYCGRPILALRVTDLSGVISGPGGAALDAPGASVHGVGYVPFRHRD